MIDTNEATDTGASPLFDQFYAVQVSDDDILEMAELLESVCDGLGTWFLDIDEEFQKDLLAGGRLFWERRKSSRKRTSSAKSKTDNPSPSLSHAVSAGTAPLTTFRVSRGLSQSGLARLIDIPQATISRIEHGGFTRTDKIRKHVRSALERFFELPLEELVIAGKAGKRATRNRIG